MFISYKTILDAITIYSRINIKYCIWVIVFLSEKPLAAFVLTLIAGVAGIIGGLWTYYSVYFAKELIEEIVENTSIDNTTLPKNFNEFIYTIALGVAIWYIVAGALLILSAILINTGIPRKVKIGGILAIIFSILSFGNLSFAVLILGLIGGILALTWKPPRKEEPMITTEPTEPVI